MTLLVDDSAAALVAGTPYVGYSYSYPHKTAYRRLDPPVPLGEVWRSEDRHRLFLYAHVPFCEFRCGFCNLFTQARPAASLPERYLGQLAAEARQVRDALPDARFAQVAIGGGTPTFLDCPQLTALFDVLERVMGANLEHLPFCIEASPATLTPEKLRLLRERGVDRLSLGVQTFDDTEAGRLGRPQSRAVVEAALDMIREVGFPVLNVDLIYGGQGQSIESWLTTVSAAVSQRPEELYLYPLYVRPLTGLGRCEHDGADDRLEMYRAARQFLLGVGYEQVSMRMFRAAHAPADRAAVAGAEPAIVYRCQEDGMVGLGCGARSYTAGLHYSTEFAVGRAGVASILADYVAREATSFDCARHGILLTEADRRRRYAILSLLQCAGIDRELYAQRFGDDALDHLPQLAELQLLGLAEIDSHSIRLTQFGLERSDAIGPWLYSPYVRRRMETSPCR